MLGFNSSWYILSYFYKLILLENLFKPRQRHLAVYMLLTSSVLSTTSKQCFELTSSVLSATSKQCFELTSSVLSTTSKQCFEQPAASLLVCSLIFIEYNNDIYSCVLFAICKNPFKLTCSKVWNTYNRLLWFSSTKGHHYLKIHSKRR